MPSRALRQLASWIALLAIVAVTFMPTITRALATGDRADVCSADFPRDSGSGDGSRHALEHCPYCALHADLALPPPPATAAGGMLAGFSELPAAFRRAPRASAVWSTSQPRAPPPLA